MDLHLSEDQRALVDALQTVLQDFAELPQSERLGYTYHSVELQTLLRDGGFLDAAREMGALEAALVVIETARLPVFAEAGASALVAPMLLHESMSGPFALVAAHDIAKAQRNLPIASTAFVDAGDDVVVLAIDQSDVEPVASVLAYPYGKFRTAPDLRKGKLLAGAGPKLRQWWRVALAAEVAGAAAAAIDFTVEYVKQRHVFGRPVGSFQSVQHRLVQCHAISRGAYYLALRAAWSGEAVHADIASCFVQQNVGKLLFDLHQFHGGMGVTNEHLLHLWTYRIRALQAEVGGMHQAARDVAAALWPAPGKSAQVRKSRVARAG
ncbi:MAG: acyl-CoA dehydrogenase family protein [Hyphomonadaceae bacterium]|nr:acyl-CoA dehydrogenase family protein [Hyphomonadaceae bacterium]